MQVSQLLLFPIHYCTNIIPFSLRVVTVITIVSISFILDLFYRSSGRTTKSATFIIYICDILRRPLLVLLCCFSIYSVFDTIQLYHPHTFTTATRTTISCYLSIAELCVLVWIIVRAKMLSKTYLG